VTGILAAAPTIDTPSVSYVALLPILIVLGAAIVGVIVEAAVPRAERFPVQVGLTLLSLIGAGITVGVISDKTLTTPSPRGTDLPFAGSLAIDKAGLFIQGTIIVLAVVATLLMAERSVDVGSPIVASAAVVVGSPDDRRRPIGALILPAASPTVSCNESPLAAASVAAKLPSPEA